MSRMTNSPAFDQATLAAAQSGDQAAFEQLVTPFRPELLVHCYRFFGSMEDAEDQLQETLLRAWRHLASFAGRASLRAWLYRIATNACLDALDRQRARGLLSRLPAPADPAAPLPAPTPAAEWLEPLADTLLSGLATDPAAVYEVRETVTLAFLALLLHLPGRQRASLILRDVLGFSASETAEMLGVSVAAANSALQRARQSMAAAQGTPHAGYAADNRTSVREAELLKRYVQAWELADSAGLVKLLREDAILTMPPVPAWYQGRAAVGAFLDRAVFGPTRAAGGQLRLVPTRANNAPAFVVYQPSPLGQYQAVAVQVLTVVDGLVAEIHDFLSDDGRLAARFGLPVSVEASYFEDPAH